MATKNTTQVLIGGKIYTMSGYESEDYLQRVAGYLNNKITQIKAAEGYTRMSQEMRSLLLNLNTADDYFKLKERSDQLSESLSAKDKELYEIKHELISTQMKLEAAARDLTVAKEEYQEAVKELTQLRTRLQDRQDGLGAAAQGRKSDAAKGKKKGSEPEEEEKESSPEPEEIKGSEPEKEEKESSPEEETVDSGAEDAKENLSADEPVSEAATNANEPAENANESEAKTDEPEVKADEPEAKAEDGAESAAVQEPSLDALVNEVAGKAKANESAAKPAQGSGGKKKYNRYYRK